MDGADILSFPKGDSSKVHKDPADSQTPPIIKPELDLDVLLNAAVAPDGDARIGTIGAATFDAANTDAVAFCAQEDALSRWAAALRTELGRLFRRLRGTTPAHARTTNLRHASGEPAAKRLYRWLVAGVGFGLLTALIVVPASFIYRGGLFNFIESIIGALPYALVPFGLALLLGEGVKRQNTSEGQRKFTLLAILAGCVIAIAWIATIAILNRVVDIENSLMGRALPEHLVEARGSATFWIVIAALMVETVVCFVAKLRVEAEQASPYQREMIPNVNYDDLLARSRQMTAELARYDQAIAARRELRERLAEVRKSYVEESKLKVSAIREDHRTAVVAAIRSARKS